MSNKNNSSNSYRYKLEQGSKKHNCPSCNEKTFVLYIDSDTKEYLPHHYGRCDRESKCSYHLLPPLETLCFYVPIDSLKDITKKAVLVKQKSGEQILPKAAILEQKETGLYVAEYFLTDKNSKRNEPLKITFDSNNKKYFHSNNATFKPQPIKPKPPTETVFFDFDSFKETLSNYEKNTFIQNLLYKISFPFEAVEVTKVIELYRLGTVANGYRAGAISFPFIDIKSNVRAIQVKQFDEQNHTTGTDFLHSIIEKQHRRNKMLLPEWLEAYTKQEKRVTCLFGEHLLSKYHSNPIALVEAPKTAIYGTLYFGQPETPESLIWLAVYNKSSFSFDKLKVLQGRFVYVFPDLSKDGNTFKEWETKAKEYESRLPGTSFIFSDLLEQLALERDKSEGSDLADYLIKQDWRLFRKQNIQEQPPQPELEKVTKVIKVTPKTNILFEPINDISNLPDHYARASAYPPESWERDITELGNYFTSIELPTHPIKLNQCSTIADCSQFIESHFATVKANKGKRTFLPYLSRLRELRTLINTINYNAI